MQTANNSQQPGSIVQDNALMIATKEGWILPTYIQLEGKKKMEITGFLNGFDIEGYYCL